MAEPNMIDTQSAFADKSRDERAFGGASPARVSAYTKRILAVMLVVISSTFVFAAIDHALWVKNNYETSIYNGSTLRSVREYFRPGSGRERFDDSWGVMIKALDVLESPDRDRTYQKLFFEDKVKFQYPPTSMVPLYWLDKLGLSDVPTLNAINIILYLLGVAGFAYMMLLLTARAEPGLSTTSQLTIVAASAVSALLFHPTFRSLEIGQIQVWINSLFLFACIAWLHGMKRTAGALIALAATIKPQLGVFLIWALLWREWRFLAGFLVAGLTVGFASLAMFGLQNHLSYLEVLSFLSKHGEAYFRNQSVNGLVSRAIGNGSNTEWNASGFAPYHPVVAAATFLSSIVILLAALLPAIKRSGRQANVVDLALVAACATLASPIAWEHHYSLALPGFGIALAMLAHGGLRLSALVWMTLAWVLIGNYLPMFNVLNETPLNFLQSYVLFAALILIAVLVGLRRDPLADKLSNSR